MTPSPAALGVRRPPCWRGLAGCGRLAAAAALAAVLARGEPPRIPPLFPVAPDAPFPNAQAAFDEVRSLLLEHYYSGDLTEEALYLAAVNGMLRHVSPPETPDLCRLYTADEYRKLLDSLDGLQVSIGVKSTFNPTDGSLTVTEVLPGSPADGRLQPYDRILRVNGERLKGRGVDEVNRLFSGDEGTAVRLTVNRDVEVFECTLTRRQFETQTLVLSRLGPRIAAVDMRRFTSTLSADLAGLLKPLAGEGVTGVILDLRGNGGGVFAESLRAAELFLPEKAVLLKTLERKEKIKTYVSSNKEPFTFDLVLLANGKTGSSAEVFISALKDNGRATLVGSRTYGKGVFEKTFELANQYRVQFITGAMYSPRGAPWQRRGVAPDFYIDQDDKTADALLKLPARERLAKDTVLAAALKLLEGRGDSD
ncbi:MAG: putative CtpA-like serine protease [Lentisphaerae bacterium ADurb.BinA184]|nr:MAG: putative CtpA-like serine protease [Lentisphaerae bacterium ADurb.BinA184]